MTEKDKKLIAEAEATPAIRWFDINEDEADTEEARRILHNIRTNLFHEEEWMSGNL